MKPIKNLEKRYTIWGLLGNTVAVWMVCLMLAAVSLGIVGNEDAVAHLNIVLIGALVVVSGYFFWGNYQKKQAVKRRPEQLAAYAAQHGLVFEQTLSEDIRSTNFRLIEQRDAELHNGLIGEDWRYGELKYFTYRHAKGGDYKAAELYYSIIELDLGRDLPNMFFDNTKSHGRQFRWKIASDQITSLEGNFDDYFVTYFPEHYDVDARSIISPEVMQAMIGISPADIEFSKNKLYVYSALRKPEDLENFVRQAQAIRTVLMDHAVYYVDAMAKGAKPKDVSVYGIQLQTKAIFPWYELLLSAIILGLLYFGVLADKDVLFMVIFAVGSLAWSIYSLYQWATERYNQRQFRERASDAAGKRYEKYRK